MGPGLAQAGLVIRRQGRGDFHGMEPWGRMNGAGYYKENLPGPGAGFFSNPLQAKLTVSSGGLMEPPKIQESLTPEKLVVEGEDPYCLSRGSCCDEGEAPEAVPAVDGP